jgi:carboxypeptidase Taq
MSDSSERAYETLRDHAGHTALLSSIEELLSWDERTMLPAAGAEHRARQMALLSGMIHDRWTDPRMGQWLAQLADAPLAADEHSDAGATIRRIRRLHERACKLPKTLVEELARTGVLGQQAWEDARARNDFPAFRPWLEKMLDLKRQEAEALSYPECPYDALLDEYEPDERTANVARVLADLREQLVPLVDRIRGSGREPDTSILRRSFPTEDQESFGRKVAGRLGFDFRRGRLDVTAHPFCCAPGPHDCRITTRYNGHFFSEAFFGILHEAGHGIYEQGLRTDQYGLPPGQAISLGVHESQSRLWENLVGRSRAFWEHFYPQAQRVFPQALGDVSLDDFYFAVNDVRPSPVRVEADEATYNLHILVRFELEQALLSGELPPSDLPGAWNEKYHRYLGIRPATDADGVLQDVHWSGGAIGYFPTYSLGNLLAAQLFAQADADLGGLAGHFRRGHFRPLFEWLRQKVHQQGQRWSAGQIVERITGRPLSHDPLIRHLRAKLEPLYGLA